MHMLEPKEIGIVDTAATDKETLKQSLPRFFVFSKISIR